MIRLSCKKPAKVQRFNDKVTVVTIEGDVGIKAIVDVPLEIVQWFENHPKVCARYLYKDIKFTVQGKAVRSDRDTDDPKLGEMIAEAKAKITLYHFLYTLSCKLFNHYCSIAFGAAPMQCGDEGYDDNLDKEMLHHGGFDGARQWYYNLWQHEVQHLNKLLDNV